MNGPKIYTNIENGFGGTDHYDQDGYAGTSVPTAIGGSTHYDKYGHEVGHSIPNALGGQSHYGADGSYLGESYVNAFGGYSHYDAGQQLMGTTVPGLGTSTYYSNDQDDSLGLFSGLENDTLSTDIDW